LKIFKAKAFGNAVAYTLSSYAVSASTVSAFALFLMFSAIFQATAAGSFSGESKKDSSQKSISMPQSPSIPSMSLPSIGSGFYAPGSSDFYHGIQNSAQSLQSENLSKSDSAKSGSSGDFSNSDSSGNKSAGIAKNDSSSQTRNAASSTTNANAK